MYLSKTNQDMVSIKLLTFHAVPHGFLHILKLHVESDLNKLN